MKYPIIRFPLENELDIILAYRRAMRIAVSCSIGISEQTSFATAISEISRNALEHGREGVIEFSVDSGRQGYIVAEIADRGQGIKDVENALKGNESNMRGNGLRRAKGIVDLFELETTSKGTTVKLGIKVPAKMKLGVELINSWIVNFKNELPVSPYEELKKKNIQLFELSERLRESEEEYRILSESAPLIIFSLDGDGKINYLNRWAKQFLGITNVLDIDHGWERFLDAEDVPVFLSNWENSRETGNTIELEYRLMEKDGQNSRWHLFKLVPYHDESGVIIKWVGFNMDIQAHKKLEETLSDNNQLKALQQKLEYKISELHASNEELEKFAYVASHDLQEPLRKITIFSDRVLNGKKDTDTLTENVSRIQKSVTRMRSLIEDLLKYSMLDKDLFFAPVDLQEILSGVIQDFDLLIEEKQAKVTLDIQYREFEANAEQLRQLFCNLISNSLKYSDPSRPPLIHITSLAEKNGMIDIVVKDNGIGFEEKYGQKIFDIFQRLHTREEFEGTGIGLAICKKVATSHSGEITAISRLNEGTDIVVRLPVTQRNSI
ncbi:MAG: ATP-binding protein [Bacteroidota bacterium]